MKTRIPFAAAFAVVALGAWACQAQTPQATPTAPNPPEAQGEGYQGLQTRTFKVPPDFLSKGWPTRDASAKGPPTKPTAKAVLEQLGVEFNVSGSTAFIRPGVIREITVTNTQEQLDNIESILPQPETVPQALVHLEVFSLPPLIARKSLIAHPKDSDLYAWIETELTKPGSAVKLERHSITIVRGGQKAKTEGINEIPHPTEFDPPTVPQNVSLPVAATPTTTPTNNATYAPWPRTEPKPDSIEFRIAGDTFEVELTFGEGLKTVDLNLAPETSRRVGIAKFGLLEDVYQPIYETQKCYAQASGFIGQPMLISTFSPPVNTGVPGGNEVDRTWLLFVTVKEPE